MVHTAALAPNQPTNCVSPFNLGGQPSGPTSGTTVALGAQIQSQCTFQIDYQAPALVGKYTAKLNATFGGDKISVAITLNVTQAP